MTTEPTTGNLDGTGLYQQDWPDSYRWFQLGFLVDDLRAAARKWVEVYDVGPFYFLKRSVQQHNYRGEMREVEIQACATQAGPVQIELIQLFSPGPNIYRDVFAQGGGLHQIVVATRKFDAMKEKYARLGYPAASEIGGGMRVAYFDTYKDFGFITELVEYSEGFMATLSKISDICAAWDGKDPLRQMTRDGYRVYE